MQRAITLAHSPEKLLTPEDEELERVMLKVACPLGINQSMQPEPKGLSVN
jgi:hypothetical protein